MAKTKKVGAKVETPKKEASPKAPAKAEPKYIVSLTYNGETEVIKGDDLIKIFSDWSPRIFKTVVLLDVENGIKRTERRLSVIQAKRIAGNFTNANIFANDLLKFLG